MTHDLPPHEQVAQQFMERKGLGDIQPVDIEKLDDQYCWYFYYELPEGDLELEVLWEGNQWHTTVSTFTLAR